MSTVNDILPPMQAVIVNFSWTPTSVMGSYTENGTSYPPSPPAGFPNVYTANTTATNTLITFTASVTPPTGVTIIQYRWDFGDGTVGFGPTSTHTYTVAFPGAAAILQATDNLGHSWSSSQTLNLFNAIGGSGNAYRIRRSS